MDVVRTPAETAHGHIGALARLPVFLALHGKRALLAGGGRAAAWKAELLSAAGAHVDIYADDTCGEMAELAADPPGGEITVRPRGWMAEDLQGAAVAVGAFESDNEAARFCRAARAAGVPVNIIDKPAFCDFSFGAIVNRSPLVIGISTDGAAPVFAQAIRAKLEALLPKGFAAWAAAAARWRDALKISNLSFNARRRFWQLFTAHALRHPNSEPADADFDRLVDKAAGEQSAVENGSVTLVGAGPGDSELLTLRAVRALQSADIILFDDLVSREVLDFARREAKKMLVGKTGFGPSCQQEDINKLMVAFAKQGRRVVRLKGGNPLIFAWAAEEIAACRAAGISVEVVPGITAAQGAAAALCLPLTGRASSRRLQFITGHAADGGLPGDIDWSALADGATTSAIYMPRKTLAALTAAAIAAQLDPQTPGLAILRATLSDQAAIAAPVAELAAQVAQENLAGPLLVILGQAVRAPDDQNRPFLAEDSQRSSSG
jgi:uroporphyrin-III C-methyltransferase / precorrin-2 dehydrogenase / sirohydrochlorin ferrochelatase